MTRQEIIVGVALDEACLTLEQLAAACAVEERWVAERIAEGMLPAVPGPDAQWRFTSAAILRVRRMRGIERDFDAAPELAALVADMLDELDELRRRLGEAR